jgi:SprT protein
MNQHDIDRAVHDACQKCKVAELAPQITWQFSRRLTSSGGNANYRTNVIKFSTIFWERADAADIRNTVYHEICHLIARYKSRYTDKYGQVRYQRIQPHGWEWKACMYRCGEEPTRCHNVNMGKRKTQTVYCLCGEHPIGPVRYKRIVSGTMSYRCRRCRGTLRLSR